MRLDALEDGVDGGPLARAPAEEGDALRVRAQARVHVAEGALQVVLLRAAGDVVMEGRRRPGTRHMLLHSSTIRLGPMLEADARRTDVSRLLEHP